MSGRPVTESGSNQEMDTAGKYNTFLNVLQHENFPTVTKSKSKTFIFTFTAFKSIAKISTRPQEVIVITSDEECEEKRSTFIPDVSSENWLPDLVKNEENMAMDTLGKSTQNILIYAQK